MNYGTIKFDDISNGPGVRVSLFVSGCENYCEGCFNSDAWDFNFGNKYTMGAEEDILNHINNNFISGLSILGGDPMHPRNQYDVLNLVKKFKNRFPNKTLWIYSGYNYEDLINNKIGEYSKEILLYTDRLVDGKFDIKLKDIGLNFRGSSNQRIIDVPESIKLNQIILDPLCIGDSDKYHKKEN